MMSSEKMKKDFIESLIAEGIFLIDNNIPFKLKNGHYSPFYINCRKLISKVHLWSSLIHIIDLELKKGLIPDFELFAGCESSGIPLASVLAYKFSYPLIYVRKEVKGYGINELVEGFNNSLIGRNVLLIDDVITDGESKVSFIRHLINRGLKVTQCLVIFDREQGGKDVLKEYGVRLHSFFVMTDILNVLEGSEKSNISLYISNPKEWYYYKGLPYHESK